MNHWQDALGLCTLYSFYVSMDLWMGGWVDGWMDGWMGGGRRQGMQAEDARIHRSIDR